MFETLLKFEKFLELIEGDIHGFIRKIKQLEKSTTPEFIRDIVDMLLFYRYFILDCNEYDAERAFEEQIIELIQVYELAGNKFKSKWFTESYIKIFMRG